MQALVEPNVLTSFLLPTTRPDGTIGTIVRAGLDRSYTLLLPAEVGIELVETVRDDPYLSAQITVQWVSGFVSELRTVAEELPALIVAAPAIGRDPADDYLLAQADAGRADYLVSGDKDLLALADRPFPFRFVSPAAFFRMLQDQGIIDQGDP